MTLNRLVLLSIMAAFFAGPAKAADLETNDAYNRPYGANTIRSQVSSSA